MRSGNGRVLLLASALVVVMGGLVSYAPTLYRAFCAATGFGGTVQRATADTARPALTSASDETVTVFFDANVAPGLDWEFRPERRAVQTRIGQPARVYYHAKNISDETVVARATFNVTPYKAAPYFFKIECFCFTEERLGPGESARMPIELYIDEQLLKDPNTSGVRQITLSYTFFEQPGLSPEAVNAARDLKSGSRRLDAALQRGETVGYDNDAPQR